MQHKSVNVKGVCGHIFVMPSYPPVNVVRDINLIGRELQHLFGMPNVFLSHRFDRDELSGQTGVWKVMEWRNVQFYGT